MFINMKLLTKYKISIDQKIIHINFENCFKIYAF